MRSVKLLITFLRQIPVSAFHFVLIFLAFVGAQGQPAFVRKDFAVSGTFLESGALSAGDFNGDGRPDVVVASTAGISVLLNQGGTSGFRFGNPVVTGISQPGPILAADFNRDGVLDLAGIGMSAGSRRPAARIFLGRGDGSFLAAREVGEAGFVATGDFNGDGIPDLVLMKPEIFSVTVLLGNGDGTFHMTAELAVSGVQPVVADFNRDGNADIAFADYDGVVSVALGKGDGTFRDRVMSSVDPDIVRSDFANSLVALDFNGDGLLDLATTSGILLGRGDGTFQTPIGYAAADADHVPCATADFNGDHKSDLVLCAFHANPGGNDVRILLGTSSITLQPAQREIVGWQPFGGVAADFDGDGQPDLAVLNGYSRTASVLLNKSAAEASLSRAVSAASGSARVAPGSIATLYVQTGAAVAVQAGPSWPTILNGLSLSVGSGAASVLASLLYVSPTQINFQVPNLAPGQEALLSIQRGAMENILVGSIQIEDVAPGLFMADQTWLTPAFTTAGSSWNLVSFFGTGFPVAPARIEGKIAGFSAAVERVESYAPGLERLDVQTPTEVLNLIQDEEISYAEVLLTADGIPANAAVLVFRYR
jgi:uncharacterized protein (TIGR03437 family)